MLLPAYFATKVVAYVLWCWLAIHTFQPKRSFEETFFLAATAGAFRALMGLAFGIVIWWLGTLVYGSLRDAPGTGLLTYALVYVPVRWVEWSLLALLLIPESRSGRAFLLGADRADRGWRAGGISVSCFADLPVIYALGGVLPVGRFLC